jgi:hypothetical protein
MSICNCFFFSPPSANPSHLLSKVYRRSSVSQIEVIGSLDSVRRLGVKQISRYY